MDKQTAVLVVHGLSIVQIKESKELLHWGSALLFGKKLARILLSLWRNYEKIVLTTFVSFMTVVRKILLVIGSELREGPSDTKLLEECCSHFVLVAEQISRRKKLAKVRKCRGRYARTLSSSSAVFNVKCSSTSLPHT